MKIKISVGWWLSDRLSIKIKEIIGIIQFNNTKILIETGHLKCQIALKMLQKDVIKDGGNFIHKFF